jgi:hypothetical protein
VSEEAELDELLAAWDERLRRVDENLIALEGDGTYQVLAGTTGKRAPLEGVTAQRVTPALDALAELFEHRGRLTEVLERAKEAKSSAGFFDKHDKLREARALLSGPSISLGTSPTPLARRGLLDSVVSDVAVTPDQLLGAMAKAFDAARDAVTQVSQAWSVLEPLIEGLGRDIEVVRALAATANETKTVGAEIDAIARDLAEYKRLVACDPLGAQGGLGAAMTPRLEGVRRRLSDLVGERERVQEAIAAADRALADVLRSHAAALAASARAVAELAHASLPSPIGEELITGLEDWLVKLKATVAAGKWHAADVGLSRWHETARQYVATDQAVAGALLALRSRRVELEGRLSARRAQLQALTARGAKVDPGLDGRANEAAAALKRRPLDVGRATELVEAFEAEVVATAARARRGG